VIYCQRLTCLHILATTWCRGQLSRLWGWVVRTSFLPRRKIASHRCTPLLQFYSRFSENLGLSTSCCEVQKALSSSLDCDSLRLKNACVYSESGHHTRSDFSATAVFIVDPVGIDGPPPRLVRVFHTQACGPCSCSHPMRSATCRD